MVEPLCLDTDTYLSALYARGTSMPKPCYSKCNTKQGSVPKQQLLSRRGVQAIVDARTEICTLTTAIGTPTLFTCSDILLWGCMTAMLTTSLLKLLRELRAVLSSVAYQKSPHALILPNSHRKVGFPNRLLNHSPTTWLYKRNARLGRTSCFQIIITSPHFRQSAMISLYKSVKLESYK